MIAEVYPLKRMPRRVKVFDYTVPENMDVSRGAFVQITIRNKPFWGVVRRVKDKPPRGIQLKPLLGVYQSLQLREEELSFFEHLAQDLVQSVSSVLFSSLPTPPKRSTQKKEPPLSWLPLTLPSSEATQVVRLVRQFSQLGQAFIQTPDIRRSIALILGYLQHHPDQKILIVAPSVRDVDLIRRRLTGHQPFVITGAETNNERWRAWEGFRSSAQGILLGTRTALMMLDASVTAVFLLRAGERTYKQEDRNPRYDGRNVVWDIRERFQANVFCLDVVPRPSDMQRFHDSERLTWGSLPTYRAIDIHQEQLSTLDGVVSYTTHVAISQALERQEQVVCIFNRKGTSKLLLCKDCGHRFCCPSCSTALTTFSHKLRCSFCRHTEPLPLRCRSCQGSNLLSIGYGNKRVLEELKEQFSAASIALIDKEHDGDLQADILVVTQHYYENLHDPFHKRDVGLVIQLDADAPLYSSDPRAVEDLMRQLWQWAWIAFSHRSPYLVQTTSADLVERALASPFDLALEELRSRTNYRLPPVYRWCRVTLKESEKRKAEIAVSHFREELQTVPEAILHATEWTRDGFAQIDVGVPIALYPELRDRFTTLNDQYIIDTNAFS